MARRLEGKVAVITGGGSGIGRCAAARFHEEGARLVIADLDPARGEETLRLLGCGGAARFCPADVSRAGDAARPIDLALREFGRLDILLNGVGVSGRRLGDGPVAECAEAA